LTKRAKIYIILLLFAALNADVAQSVAHILGKDEVTGSNPVISSIKKPLWGLFSFAYL
jgi:hypothetical protein